MNSRYQNVYFFALLAIALFVMFQVVRPYIAVIFLSLVFAVIFNSYHERLEKRIVSKNLAAAAAVLSVVALILIPMAIIVVVIFFEAKDFYGNLSNLSINQHVLDLQNRLDAYFPGIDLNIQQYLRSGLDWIISHTSSLFTGFFKLVLDLVIMLFALFYLFKDGKKMRSYFVKLSPLDETDDNNILNKLELTVNSVVRGSLIVALIQGTLTAIGFAIFKVSDQPILWGMVAALASLVPGVGTGLVNVPTIIILFATGHIPAAIGFTIWSILVTGSVDNFVGPRLINSRVNIHPFLILISVLGGVAFFGPIGFLAGPIALAFATELLKLYPKFISKTQ